ncbi:MAG: hypothetical protein GY929_05590 [Actinomycetia bacterium]|nr:hypothetical protein [Actinomycetes bacterium]
MTEAAPAPSNDETDDSLPQAVTGLAEVLGTGRHRALGQLYVGFALVFLVTIALLSLFLGIERFDTASFGLFDDAEMFEQVFSLTRAGLVFLVILPLTLGLAFVVLPLQIGARTIAFPRAAAASFWGWLVSSGIFIAAYAVNGGPVGGRSDGIELWLLSLMAIVVSLLLGTISAVTTVLTMRTKGMSLDRAPLFAWSMVVGGTVWLASLAVLLANLLVAYVGFRYNSNLVPDGSIWSQVSWAFGQPQVFAYAVPALGIVASVAPTFSGTRLRPHWVGVAAIGLFGVLGFGAYAQNFFSSSNFQDEFLFVADGLLVALPVLAILGLCIDTMRRGRPQLSEPAMIFSLGGLLLILAGSVVAGLQVIWPLEASLAEATDDGWNLGYAIADGQANFVLLGALMVLLGGLYYWEPNMSGRLLGRPLGLVASGLFLLGTLFLALPDVISGFLDQPALPVQLPNLDGGAEAMNAVALVGPVLLVLGALVVLFDVLFNGAASVGAKAGNDPWNGQTLEWSISSPAPPGNFAELPTVRSETPLFDGEPATDESEEA